MEGKHEEIVSMMDSLTVKKTTEMINEKVQNENNPTENQTVKKRTRRRTRTRKKKVCETLNKDESEDFSCLIKAVLSQKNGHFLRRRNSGSKKIRLKTFKTNSSPCIFISPKKNESVSTNRKMSVSNKKTKKQPQKKNMEAPSTSKKVPGKENKEKKKHKNKEVEEHFKPFFTSEEVKIGLEKGELIRGVIRINPKNFKDAYVSNQDTSLTDYFINSVVDRNRALEGDEVIIKLKPKEEWTDDRPLCFVVYIEKPVNPRITIGHLKLPQNKNSNKSTEYAIFYPRDKRLPFMRIPRKQWPKGFGENPKKFEDLLFVAKIFQWQYPKFALGVLTECLGYEGNLNVEEMAILREFCLDVTPFDDRFVRQMNLMDGIKPDQFQYRKDLRLECIFTIDPLTARDLDDAVSVKELENGNYEIGVHISDVAHYVKDGSELDYIVAKKATTIYLVNNVYHMLPRELCMHCSLLPGKDKCAFSVIWEMTPKAKIVKTSFTRSIINSCTQLAYEHAQLMLENPEKDFTTEEMPEVLNGFTYRDLSKTVNILQKLAVLLRKKREQNGALKIDQVKLLFGLDSETGEPNGFRIYENKESHRLIEEFMLLANISVAERINEFFPDIAFLRCHEPPKQTMMVKLQSNLENYGIHMDISSSGSISASLRKYITDDEAGRYRAAVLNHLFAKPMTRARYLCAANDDEDNFHHFALSVPLYTHFTSPIRRYADIMVHRLLAASLGYQEKPEWPLEYVQSIAANCNGQKYNAKRAGDASSELYLAHYVEKNQPFIEDAVVVDVKQKCFDAIVLKTGSIVRVYNNSLPDNVTWKSEPISEDTKGPSDMKMWKVTISFPKTEEHQPIDLIIEIFTHVKVNLTRKNMTYKLEASLLRPV